MGRAGAGGGRWAAIRAAGIHPAGQAAAIM